MKPEDLSSKNLRKRLSDFKFIMQRVEDNAKEKGVWKDRPTELEALEIFEKAGEVIQLPDQTKSGHKRRRGQLSWVSAVNIMRVSQKVDI